MNNVFIGALAYADDITIICPSLRGLNKMLEICNEYIPLHPTHVVDVRKGVRSLKKSAPILFINPPGEGML